MTSDPWGFDAAPEPFDADLSVARFVSDYAGFRAGESCAFDSAQLRAALDAGLVVLVGGAAQAAVLLRSDPFARWRGGELR